MLNSKKYLKILFLILGLLLTATTVYANYFSTKYPLPLTNHISLDAKLKFVRDHIDPDKIDTLIVGSSLALNNVEGDRLEDQSTSCKKVLNLSAYGVSTLQAEQLTQLGEAFPNLQRIIYSAQYSDFPHGKKVFVDFKPELLIKYMRRELGTVKYQLLVSKSCKDIKFCLDRQKSWAKEHNQSNSFGYLGFDRTGSVPLEIYGDDIIGHRWRNPHPGIMSSKSFAALDRMAHHAHAKGIKFYLAHQPYRKELAKRDKVKGALNHFSKTSQEILTNQKGTFLGLHELMNLPDKYFADRTHLNSKGCRIVTDEIAKLIDMHEQK